MYKVIGTPKSRALRVVRFLEEAGLPYELEPELPRSDAVMKINPTGKIPVLIDDDLILSDSVAIMTYLADKHNVLTHPAGSKERARQDAITHYILCEVDAALWLAGKHSFALPEELRVPAVKPTAKAEFAKAMDHLADILGDQAFLTGDKMTIPDILLSHCAGWAMVAKFDLPEGRLGDYLKRMTKTEAMGRIMQVIKDNA